MIIPEEGLILNVFKPAGITSFGVVQKIRQQLKVKKIGHAGTLDPMAEGVLIILVGKAAKRQDEFMQLEKTYSAGILLGTETDSFDITGNIIRLEDYAQVTKDRLVAVLELFKGEIEQVPPMFSAVKVGGKRLYKLARQGMEVERKPRLVRIQDIHLQSWDPPRFKIEVRCSKGTYIRSLAHDIGRELGCGACMESLNRTSIGDYNIDDALKIQEITID